MRGFAELASERRTELECGGAVAGAAPQAAPDATTSPAFWTKPFPNPIPASPGTAPPAALLPPASAIIDPSQPAKSPQSSSLQFDFGMVLSAAAPQTPNSPLLVGKQPLSPVHLGGKTGSVRKRSVASATSSRRSVRGMSTADVASAFPGLVARQAQRLEGTPPNTGQLSASPPPALDVQMPAGSQTAQRQTAQAAAIHRQEREQALRTCEMLKKTCEQLTLTCGEKAAQLKLASDDVWLLREQLAHRDAQIVAAERRCSQYYQHALQSVSNLRQVEQENGLLAVLVWRLSEKADKAAGFILQARQKLASAGTSPQIISDILARSDLSSGVCATVSEAILATHEPAIEAECDTDVNVADIVASLRNVAVSGAAAQQERPPSTAREGSKPDADATAEITRTAAQIRSSPIAELRREALQQLIPPPPPQVAADSPLGRKRAAAAARPKTDVVSQHVCGAALKMLRVNVRHAEELRSLRVRMRRLRTTTRRKMMRSAAALERQLMQVEDAGGETGPAPSATGSGTDSVESLKHVVLFDAQQHDDLEKAVTLSAFRDVLQFVTDDAVSTVRRYSRGMYQTLRRASEAVQAAGMTASAARSTCAAAAAAIQTAGASVRSFIDDFGDRLYYFCMRFAAKEGSVKEHWIRSVALARTSVAVQADMAADRYLSELGALRIDAERAVGLLQESTARQREQETTHRRLAKAAIRLHRSVCDAVLPASVAGAGCVAAPVPLSALRGDCRLLCRTLRAAAAAVPFADDAAAVTAAEAPSLCESDASDDPIFWPEDDAPSAPSSPTGEHDVAECTDEVVAAVGQLLSRLDGVLPAQQKVGPSSGALQAMFAAQRFKTMVSAKQRQDSDHAVLTLQTSGTFTGASPHHGSSPTKSLWKRMAGRARSAVESDAPSILAAVRKMTRRVDSPQQLASAGPHLSSGEFTTSGGNLLVPPTSPALSGVPTPVGRRARAHTRVQNKAKPVHQ